MDAAADPDGGMVAGEAARAGDCVVGGGEAVSEPTMKGPAPHRACCGHSEAWHVDMLDGHEQCAGCDCRTATGTVDAAPREHDLTPSEVAVARVLRAWEEWPLTEEEVVGSEVDLLDEITNALERRGWVRDPEENEGDYVVLAGEARVLLDRARKAGVL